MGTGWRRAFCTAVSRDTGSDKSEKKKRSSSPSPSPRSCVRLGFFSGGSNSSTPRSQLSPPVSSSALHCRTTSQEAIQTPSSATKTQRIAFASNPSSPRSPLKLSLFKSSFKFRSSCGICLHSVKTGQGTAIYTAECAHAFHFPCIAAHVGKHNNLVCPVCNTTWKDVPLLSIHKNAVFKSQEYSEVVLYSNIGKPKTEEQKMIDSSPRATKINIDQLQRQRNNQSSYDDDEPLFSPTSGGRIIPIPEADENDEIDDVEEEEFQGFFVNPKTSSSIKSYPRVSEINQRELRSNVQARFLPESALISTCHGNETHAVALRVKAPPPPFSSSSSPLLQPSHRAPIDLVTVLDVSGSMSGAKLLMLKRAMRLVISSLSSADRLSIVAFSATAKRLLPLKRMNFSGQSVARKIIDRLVCGQGTNVGQALRKATRVLEDRRDKNPVASIMLLSDGQDERVNRNERNQRQEMTSNQSSTRFAHIEIPVHAYGFGEQGRRYTDEPAEEAFTQCVGGLLSVVVHNLRIQLSFQSGSSPAEIAAVYSSNGRPTVCNSGSVRVGDLYSDEEREVLVELKLPSSTADSHRVISVQCIYKDPSTQEVVYGKEQSLLVPRLHSVRTSAPKVESLRNLFITSRAVAESRRSIEHDDYRSARHLLASARALLMQSSSISANEYIRALEAELEELQWKRQQIMTHRRRGTDRDSIGCLLDQKDEQLTPTSAWRAAEKLAKVAMMKSSLTSRVSDLHGFENARF